MMQTKPIYLDNPTPEQKKKLDDFFTGAGVSAKFADSMEDAVITVQWPNERHECDENNLFADGFSTCPNAFKVAAKIGVERAVFGQFLNALDIKLKQCQFGCF